MQLPNVINFYLTAEQRQLLRGQLRSTNDIDLYRRTLALLEADQGRSPIAVAHSLGVSRSSVYNWLKVFTETPQPDSLADHRGHGRPSLWTDTLERILWEALLHPPDLWGLEGADWTVPLLRAHLVRQTGKCVSETTIRRRLHQQGYVWDNSRFVPSHGAERGTNTFEFRPVVSGAAKPAIFADNRRTAANGCANIH